MQLAAQWSGQQVAAFQSSAHLRRNTDDLTREEGASLTATPPSIVFCKNSLEFWRRSPKLDQLKRKHNFKQPTTKTSDELAGKPVEEQGKTIKIGVKSFLSDIAKRYHTSAASLNFTTFRDEKGQEEKGKSSLQATRKRDSNRIARSVCVTDASHRFSTATSPTPLLGVHHGMFTVNFLSPSCCFRLLKFRNVNYRACNVRWRSLRSASDPEVSEIEFGTDELQAFIQPGRSVGM